MDQTIIHQWKKAGLIIKAQGLCSWSRSHAMLPTVLALGGDIYRIYFSGRDENNRSHIGYVEIDITDPAKILTVSDRPVLSPGSLGCFDDCGVTPSWITEVNGKLYLYYIGWKMRSSVRMGLVAGLAISRDGGKSFARYSRAPLLERTDLEPYSILTAPCVLREEGEWKMWYVSGVEWKTPDLPRYNIKLAVSTDGTQWRREGTVCIDFSSSQENALARPCVLKENDVYKMWYAYKKDHYRIGYAESLDGIHWKRKDEEAGIDVSEYGWDAQMIEYAYVFNHGGRKHMFYNGNEYGKEGIGHAVL